MVMYFCVFGCTAETAYVATGETKREAVMPEHSKGGLKRLCSLPMLLQCEASSPLVLHRWVEYSRGTQPLGEEPMKKKSTQNKGRGGGRGWRGANNEKKKMTAVRQSGSGVQTAENSG